jgi:hypothetical protein
MWSVDLTLSLGKAILKSCIIRTLNFIDQNQRVDAFLNHDDG